MGVAVLSGPGHVPVLEDRTGPAVHPPDQGVSPAAAMAGLEQLQRALELLLAPTAFPLEAIAPDERILLQRLATPVLDPPADEPESHRQHHYRAADLVRGLACVPIGAGGWALGAWGALRPGSPPRRVLRAGLGAAAVFLLAAAAVVVPRPVPRLESADSSATVIDYHAHTAASHDGRRGWSPADLAAWHAAQGFQASYVTDHNVPYPPLSP